MNEEMEQFERRLRRQPMKQIPAGWRAEILAAAECAARPAPRAPSLATCNRQLATIFWPHPAAWAGLAAIWIFILAVNFSLRSESPALVEKTSPPSPEAVAELRQQQRMFAELLGVNDSCIADRRKFLPQPRSERIEILAT